MAMIARISRQRSAWRIALPAWLAVWMLAMPLVHVHPEVDHRHGALGHVHGGTIHTVFSSALACEFAAYNHASVSAGEARCPLHLVAQPFHALEYLEINFVFASSEQAQTGKVMVADAVVGTNETDLSRGPRSLATTPLPDTPASFILASSISSRAPPTI